MTLARSLTLALAVLGASMAATSFVSARSSGDFGPWLMPIGVGTFLTIVCVVSLFSGSPPVRVSSANTIALAIAGAALLVYPFVLFKGGFLLVTCALAAILGMVSTSRPRWLIAASGVIAVVVVWAGFTMLLGARLPNGIF